MLSKNQRLLQRKTWIRISGNWIFISFKNIFFWYDVTWLSIRNLHREYMLYQSFCEHFFCQTSIFPQFFTQSSSDVNIYKWAIWWLVLEWYRNIGNYCFYCRYAPVNLFFRHSCCQNVNGVFHSRGVVVVLDCKCWTVLRKMPLPLNVTSSTLRMKKWREDEIPCAQHGA